MNRPDAPAPRSRARLSRPALAALTAALVAVVVIAALSYRSLAARSEAADAVNRTNDVQDQLHRFLSSIKDAETGQRGFLLTGDENYLAPYQLALGAIDGELATLRRTTADNRAQQRRLDVLEPLVSSKLAELEDTISRRRNGDETDALAIVRSDRGQAAMERIRGLIETMLEAEQALLVQRTETWEATVQWSSYVMFGGVAVLVAMILTIGVLASRSYRAVEGETWARRVHLALTAELAGDLRLASIGDKVLRALVDHFGARVGAIYVAEGGELRRIAGHALPPNLTGDTLRPGDGLTGQAARTGRAVHVRDVPEGYLDVTSTVGKTRPRELVIAPAQADGVVHAVTELGFLHRIDAVELGALDRMSESIAIAIRTARDRSQLEDLLEEVQRQAEELTAQQDELRAANEELEHQTDALQQSQALLETQQHELEQINAQLEHQRDELIRAGAELQRANDYKSQFLANMSHELRTPLNSSLILAKLLADNRDGNLSPDQVQYAQTIHAAGNDLLTLINDILDLSKIEAGMLDVRAEPVAVARLADELLRTFQPVADHKQLALEVRVDPSAPEVIDSDPTRLHQILKNLLSNAIKFTERGGVALEIAADGGELRFAVRDTGIGIAADQHAVIFDAFRQLDAATNRQPGGTGLGLAISRDLARLLGGELRVVSAPGHGSTFTLALPLRPPGARSAVLRRAPAGPATAPRAAAPVGPAPFPDDRDRTEPGARTLLVIEDDVAFARVLYDLAHELEFLAVVAATAEDGLALARRTAPSAIVLDVGLPDRSGLAVLDALKRDPHTRHVPVHVVSVSDHTRTALEMGAAGYVVKPVDRERLTDAIRQLEARFTQKLRRVLIVEDDPVLRDSSARLLAGDDVEIVTAGTAAEAKDQLRTATFDCMVIDLALPDRSGLALLEDMARGERCSFPPVIVYTQRSLAQGEVDEVDEIHALDRLSRSLVIKGARSPERLLDEVTLFLHQVESRLSPERQRMLRDARDREAAFEGRRILVVEDDVRNVFALSNLFETRGAIIEIARNGREAVEHLRARPGADLVLMDIMMPEMDGIAAIRALRDDPELARLPIIALTAKAMPDDREHCLAAGANDYIAKPLDVDKLLSLARVWIRR